MLSLRGHIKNCIDLYAIKRSHGILHELIWMLCVSEGVIKGLQSSMELMGSIEVNKQVFAEEEAQHNRYLF